LLVLSYGIHIEYLFNSSCAESQFCDSYASTQFLSVDFCTHLFFSRSKFRKKRMSIVVRKTTSVRSGVLELKQLSSTSNEQLSGVSLAENTVATDKYS